MLRKELIVKRNVLNTLRQTMRNKNADDTIASLVQGIAALELERLTLRPIEGRIRKQQEDLDKAQKKLRDAKAMLAEASDMVSQASKEVKSEALKLKELQKEKEEKDAAQRERLAETSAGDVPMDTAEPQGTAAQAAAQAQDEMNKMKAAFENQIAQQMQQMRQMQQEMAEMRAAAAQGLPQGQEPLQERRLQPAGTLEEQAARVTVPSAPVTPVRPVTAGMATPQPQPTSTPGRVPLNLLAAVQTEVAAMKDKQEEEEKEENMEDLVAKLERDERERLNKVAMTMEEANALDASTSAASSTKKAQVPVFHIADSDDGQR
eukprot:TRINITY_DN38851_c0_g1_i3.p2 TRINITY_DN38851_c0_g1~~TRINITY_DN38851_c0_g1_i3.p2  ORF type:complete len:320 (-),score=122.92 TRINITY_DN38851_c0_g1_i3:1339-2298(-)